MDLKPSELRCNPSSGPECEIRRQPSSGTRMVSTVQQIWHLVKLLLLLKGWKFLWLIVVLVAVFSNHFIFILVDNWMGNFGRTITRINTFDFFWNSVILLNPIKYQTEFINLIHLINSSTQVEYVGKYAFELCNDSVVCHDRMFKSLYGRFNTSKYLSHINYGEIETSSANQTSTLPQIVCQVAYGADLNCPYLGHLVASTKSDSLFKSGYAFKDIEFFSLTAPIERSGVTKEILQINSMCAQHSGFDPILSRTVMIQTIVLVCAVSFYFLVSTVSCIANLKKNGFLAVLFRKGLSIKAFWIAVWSITAVEILIMAVLFTLSHAFQCLGFYQASALLLVFIQTAFQLSTIAAFGYMLTVMVGKYFHIGLIVVLLAILSSTCALVLRLVFSTMDMVRAAFLAILPLGHHGEFTRAQLLTVILPDAVTYYHHLILALSIVSAVFIVLLTLYLDYVLPTGNGWRMPRGYIFDSFFWNFSPEMELKVWEDPLAGETIPDQANIEPMQEGYRPIVRTSHIVRQYQKGGCFSRDSQTILALNDINIRIYEHQITAIIGHNASGKTTLLNIMNGTDSPTSGQVSVNGLLMNDPINRIRLHRFVGVCTQEDSLSNLLTVSQIIELALMSCNRSMDDPEANYLLKALQIDDKKAMLTTKISRGMKRKLCTVIALLGDAKLLFLDEPTSGVDPVSRREMWTILQQYRKKCSIILSTQSMDEADALADRKIFLSGGALICAGSSMFLKSAFDCGFQFNVTLKSPNYVPLLIKQMQQDFTHAKVTSQFRTNIDFRLPASDIDELHAFAQGLERRSAWIEAFGLHQASLYDIFMRLRDLQPSQVESLFKEGRIGLSSEEEETAGTNETARKPSTLGEIFQTSERKTSPSTVRKFRAMAYINVIRMIRSNIKLGSRIITPVLLLIILLVMAFIEKVSSANRMDLRNNLTNSGDGLDRAVCVFRSHTEGINASQCAHIFQPSAADVRNFLVLEINDSASLTDFLKEPAQIEKIKTVCPPKLKVVCPIIYTDKWNTSYTNYRRVVAVGSFSSYEYFNTSTTASVTIGAYRKFAYYFLSKRTAKVEVPKHDYMFTAHSVYNLQSTFVPLYSIFVQLLIISLLPATFLDDLIEDKANNVRYQLSSMGLGILNYWITMFLVHWIQYAAVYILSVILVVAINASGYLTVFYLAGIVLPTLLLGLGNNQLTVYILSSVLNKSSSIVTVTYFFFSTFIVILILTAQLDNFLGILLIVLVPPAASLALTFHGTKVIFYTISYFTRMNEALEEMKNVFFFQKHIVAALAIMFVHALCLTTIFSLLERRVQILKIINSLRGAVIRITEQESHEDPGVVEEAHRLDEALRNPDNLLEVRHLKMVFSNGAKVLRDITFATTPGEIFGLLGPNGAGKSTVMAIMVGHLEATGGRCEVQCAKHWFSSRLAARKGFIGYCPQYNPHYEDVTVREHLEFYASIFGVPEAKLKSTIDSLLESLELNAHENKLSCELSYGFKRRLSLAAALLGDPCLLVIDEASTGVDPEGKQIIWKSIRSLAGKQRCVVISTHSMEEVEALCTRVSVMNFGSLVGLGSVQQLKSRYGQSNTLEVLIEAGRDEPISSLDMKRSMIINAVERKFTNSCVVEEFTNRITFSIPQSSIGRLSNALSWLAEIKKASNIMYFSFHQMSLDQVFAKMITMHNTKMVVERRNSESIESAVDATWTDSKSVSKVV